MVNSLFSLYFLATVLHTCSNTNLSWFRLDDPFFMCFPVFFDENSGGFSPKRRHTSVLLLLGSTNDDQGIVDGEVWHRASWTEKSPVVV